MCSRNEEPLIPARDELDAIDQAVARITDADIDARLRKVLGQPAPGVPLPGLNDFDLTASVTGLCDPARIFGELADLAARAGAAEAAAVQQLRQAREAVEAARRDAAQIVAEAREETDTALTQAAQMLRDARAAAAQMLRDARAEADEIMGEARTAARQMITVRHVLATGQHSPTDQPAEASANSGEPSGLAARRRIPADRGHDTSRVADLTRRDLDVMAALCRPLLTGEASEPPTVAEIAADLVITQYAVKQHLLRLYAKLRIPEGPGRRLRLADEAIALRLVHRPGALSDQTGGPGGHLAAQRDLALNALAGRDCTMVIDSVVFQNLADLASSGSPDAAASLLDELFRIEPAGAATAMAAAFCLPGTPIAELLARVAVQAVGAVGTSLWGGHAALMPALQPVTSPSRAGDADVMDLDAAEEPARAAGSAIAIWGPAGSGMSTLLCQPLSRLAATNPTGTA